MDGYVTKPIDARTLIQTIESFLPVRRPPRGVRESADQHFGPTNGDSTNGDSTGRGVSRAIPSASDGEPIDSKQLLARCLDNREVAARVLQKFRLRSSEQLPRIERAIAAADDDTLSRTAHLLKGMAANVAAGPVAFLAAQLEHAAASGDWGSAVECASRLQTELIHADRAAGQLIDQLQPAAATQDA